MIDFMEIARFLVQFVMQRLLRLTLFVYFHEVDIQGQENLPPTGAFVLVCNHPNVSVDVALATAACEPKNRIIVSWAKSTLFATPVANFVMRLMGAVPVHRKQDAQPDETVSNDELFASSYAGHAPKMFPLKKGVAWLLAGYYKKTGKKIPVVPCALNYMKKEKFRSGVLVEFGPSMDLVTDDQDIDASVPADKRDYERVQRATVRLESVLDSMIVQADDFRTLKLLSVARSIYSAGHKLNLKDTVRLQKRFTDYYRSNANDPAIQLLVDRVGKFSDAVDELGLKEYHFDENLTVPAILQLAVHRVVRLCMVMPFALIGAVLAAPLYLVARRASESESYVELKSTNKLYILFASILLIGLVWSLVSFYLYGFLGVIIGLSMLSAFTWAHLNLMQEGVHAFRSTLSLVRLLSTMLLSSAHVDALQRERAALKAAIQARADQAFAKNNRIISDPNRYDAAIDETSPEDKYI